MPYEVEAFGKIIEVPDDVSHADAYKQIMANKHKLGYDEFTDPENFKTPNPEALDYAKGFAAGANKLVSGVGYLAEAAGAKETGKAIREFGDRGAAYWNSKLSPGGKKAAESQVFVDDPESITGLRLGDDAGKALLMGASQSLPSMFAAALPGVAITKGIQALASLGLAGGAGATIPLLAGTAAPVGTAANVIARVPSAIGFGAAEGIVSGAMNAAEFKSSIEGMSDKELSKSPVYLALKAEHGEEKAKQLIADQAASDIFGRTALSTGTIGAVTGGGALGQAYQKATIGAGDGILKSIAKGAGQEALQETPQSGGEKYIENLATRDYLNPDVDVSSGVLSSAASGGAIGAFTGGIFGGGSAINITSDAQSKADRINAERAKLGLDKIVKSETVDQAINAANESVSQKPVDKDDVLRVADPTLADIERLTGLKPSESIQEAERQQSISSQAQQENKATQSDLEGQKNQKPKTARDTEIVLPDNKTLNAQWDIVDADNVKASLKNGESQPRDRTRAASDLQIQSIAKNPDYRRLSDSPVMDIGAPVLSNDGHIVGGNGRFEAISRAYDQDTAQEYLDNLRQDAIKKGIDPAVIDQMKKPVLVRRISQPFDTRQLAIASNSGMSAQYSDLEQAKIDSERLKGLEDIITTGNGDIALTADNIRRVRDSLGNYSPAEIAPFVDANGQLSQQGIKRIRNAMLAKAYGDNPVIQEMIESNDSDVRNILGALTRVVGDAVKSQSTALKESNVTPSILEAVNIYNQLKQKNQPVSNYLKQQDAFSDKVSPAVENVLMFLDKNARSQPKLTEFFRDAYTKLGSIDTKTADIFGQEVKPKPEDLFAKPTIESQLEKHLKKNGYEFDVKPVTEREFNALSESKKAQKELAEKQAKIFGKKVVFVKAKGNFGINGVMVPAIKDTIFINLETPKPFHAVMAHELSHWMEQEHPSVYKDMLGSLKDVIVNEEGYRKKYGITEQDEGLIQKEIAADLMGDNFTDETFWNKVAAANPDKWKEIAKRIIQWLKNTILKAKSRGMGSEEWVTDAKKAQDIIANAVAQYTKQQDAVGKDIKFHKAFHGSPHDHNKFDSSKIGTGEGAQAYGYGHYFADSKEVAEYYKEQLSDNSNGPPRRFFRGKQLTPGTPEYHAGTILSRNDITSLKQARDAVKSWIAQDENDPRLQKHVNDLRKTLSLLNEATSKKDFTEKPYQGKLYEVELAPEQDEYLLWDKPLSEQSEKVKSAISNLSDSKSWNYLVDQQLGGNVYDQATGRDLYKAIQKTELTDKAASEYLHSLGIRGIKYLDGTSRAKGEGAYNYVIFDDKDIEIKAKFSKQEQENKDNYRLRTWIPVPRSPGWTQAKIIRALKSKAWSRAFGKSNVLKEIARFDSAKEFEDHIYYHGTANHLGSSLVPSITMSEAQAERSGGGGYGERYWAISLSKSKNIASNFTGQSRYGNVYGVILKKGANVQEIPGIQDAADIEDHIVQLWNDGVDAVRIGGGEEELAVLNPYAIVRYADGESFQVFQKKKFEPLTTDQIENIYNVAKDYAEKIKNTPAEERKNIEVPEIRFSKQQIPGTIKELEELWDAKGISNFISEKNGVITLSKIVIPKEQRNNGIGTSAMNELIDYADRTGQRIALTPSSDFGGNKSRLLSFYKRFGFVENTGRNKDYSISESMFRDPIPANISASKELPKTIIIDGTERPTTNSEGKLIHPTEKGIRKFWKWFGDGYLTDVNGRPSILYHQTSIESSDNIYKEGFRIDKPRARKSDPRVVDGIFFKPSPDNIGLGSSNENDIDQIPVYLNIKNPLVANTAEEVGDIVNDKIYLGLLRDVEIADANLAKEFDDKWKSKNLDRVKFKEFTEEFFPRSNSIINDLAGKARERLTEVVSNKGYDGVIIISDKGSFGRTTRTIIALNPNQIKSAIENNGEFSKSNNDIRFSQQKPFNPNEDIPETKVQKAQRIGQDKFNRFRVIKEWLAKEKGINLSEAADVYGAEERYYGKVANQQEDFREKIRNPLIEKISKAGYKLDDVEQYLLNRHAQEANAQNRKLTGKEDSTAYGISDADAQAYLDKAPKELAKLADEVQALTDKAQQLRLDNGIETQERIDAMNGAYKYYVPVRGDAESQQKQNQYKGTGKGFSMKYKPKRRLGHELRNESVIENIFQDYERAVIQVEKNRVFKSLALMAAEIQMPELISIDQPVKRKVLRTDTAFTVEHDGQIRGVFNTMPEAQMFKKVLEGGLFEGKPSSNIKINKTQDQRLIYSASPMLADNEVVGYMNGHEIRLQVNDELLARAYKNMGTEALGNILSTGRAINGWMSKAYTGYNPEFLPVNIQRDFTTGVVNLTGEQGILIAAKAVANYPKSFASLLKYAFNGKSDKWIDAYRDNGGNTGAAYLPDLERLGEEVKREYASYQGVIANLKEGDSANALRAAGRKAFNATLKYINHLNAAGENAFRLATFKAMVESGKSVNEAASMAKNVTVNFNRKGEMGAELNALYLFFNASLQGTAATSHALFKGRHKYQAWGLSGAMMAVGYMMASMLGGFDDEDKYDEISDATKSRNLIMSYGDGYVKIPVPYGYGFFYNAGRMYAEAQRKGEIGKMPYQLMALATEEFSPFNVASTEDSEFSSKKVYYGFLPTMLKIPAEITNNYSSFANRELYPEKTWYQSEPDNEKMWRGTKGTVYDISAQYLASIGIEISPEVLRYMTRTATGGSGAFVDSAVSGAMLKSQGAELEAREIPFARKFYGENTIQDARARYGKAKEEARIAFEKFSALNRKQDLVSVEKFLDDKNELLALNDYANSLSDVIRYIRDQQDEIKLSDQYTTAEKRLKIKELEKEEKSYYDMFMKQYKTVKH